MEFPADFLTRERALLGKVGEQAGEELDKLVGLDKA